MGGTPYDFHRGIVLPWTPMDANSQPPDCSAHDVEMCNKYTKRNINTTGRPFSVVYPEVYNSYLRTSSWALTAEEAYSDVEDETQASAK
eukprot:5594668-Prorocentrum_lima.AAC.1